MKRFLGVLIVCCTLMAGICLAGDDTLTQVSTIDALMTGVYDGEMSLSELKAKGDFGIGTFNGLNGEMVLLDGVFYQVLSTGAVVKPDLAIKTPFAAVTFFKADRKVPLQKGMTFNMFTDSTEKIFPTRNIFYAIKISGTFRKVKTRSVPAQQKPYRPLSEVVKTQPVFDISDVRGTIAGFWCPSYVKGINVPGYHLHFLSADAKQGGHVLDFTVDNAIMEIDDTNEFFLALPDDSEYSKANLEKDRSEELKAVEK